MTYGFDTALLFTLEWCVQERSGQAQSQTAKNTPQLFIGLTAQRTVWQPKKTLVTAPNKPLSLYQLPRRSLTWQLRQCEGVTLLNNLSWRWAKLPLRSHDNPAPQLFNNELKAPSVCSLAMVHASPTNPRVTLRHVLQTVPLYLSDGNPL